MVRTKSLIHLYNKKISNYTMSMSVIKISTYNYIDLSHASLIISPVVKDLKESEHVGII